MNPAIKCFLLMAILLTTIIPAICESSDDPNNINYRTAYEIPEFKDIIGAYPSRMDVTLEQEKGGKFKIFGQVEGRLNASTAQDIIKGTFKAGGPAGFDPMLTTWGFGACHTLKGTLKIAGYTFVSNSEEPFVFHVVKNRGYVYETGQGIVTTPAGEKIVLRSAWVSISPDQSVRVESAIHDGRIDSFREMLDKAPTLATGRLDRGNTLLHSAAFYGQADMVRLLIEHGADVNAVNHYGSSALYQAALMKNTEEAARILLEKGADVNAASWDGETPLHRAVISPTDLVKLLIEYGAKVDVKDNEGKTPVEIAIMFHNAEAIKLMKDELDGAIADYTRAIEHNVDVDVLGMSYINRGRAKQAKGDLNGAIADYDKGIELKAADLTDFINCGIAKQAKGDLDGAITDYTKGINIGWGHLEDAYYNRGIAKQSKGDLDGGIADYTAAIKLKPDFPQAYDHRGIAKQAKGDLDGAQSDQTKANQLKPRAFPVGAQNTVSFDNQSGEPALVKLKGPTSSEIEVPDGTKQAVQASAGKYFIKVRYGVQGKYHYTKGEEFTVEETATTRSKITITLHKVVNGNYDSRPINEEEFGAGNHTIAATDSDAKGPRGISKFAIADFKSRITGTSPTTNTFVAIKAASNADGFIANGRIEFINIDGRLRSTIWSPGAVHVLLGDVTIDGYKFSCRKGSLLTFHVSLDEGYVFDNGRGTVTKPTGELVILQSETAGQTVATSHQTTRPAVENYEKIDPKELHIVVTAKLARINVYESAVAARYAVQKISLGDTDIELDAEKPNGDKTDPRGQIIAIHNLPGNPVGITEIEMALDNPSEKKDTKYLVALIATKKYGTIMVGTSATVDPNDQVGKPGVVYFEGAAYPPNLLQVDVWLKPAQKAELLNLRK